MTDENLQENVSQAQYEEFLEIVQNIRNPLQLAKSERLQSCLVSNYLRENTGLSSLEAFQEVLLNILLQLDGNRKEYGDILRGRFWEGKQIDEMLETGRPWPPDEFRSERTFLYHQKKAVTLFAFWFLHKEKKCITNSKLLENTSTIAHNKKRTFPKAMAIIILMIFVLFLGILTTKRLSFQTKLVSTSLPTEITLPTNIASPTKEENTLFTLCGENNVIEDIAEGQRFIASQGVSSFTAQNTPGGILGNRIREVKGVFQGVIIGYFDTAIEPGGGLSVHDRTTGKNLWADCTGNILDNSALINSILVDNRDQIWVSTDGQGVFRFNGQQWDVFTPENSGLPSSYTFELSADNNGNIWIATIDGIATFQKRSWEKRFEKELFKSQLHPPFVYIRKVYH